MTAPWWVRDVRRASSIVSPDTLADLTDAHLDVLASSAMAILLDTATEQTRRDGHPR